MRKEEIMQNIDELLQNALSPSEKMSDELKERIMMQINGNNEQIPRKFKKFGIKTSSLPAAAALAMAIMMVLSAASFAAWKYLSAKDVAQKLDDEKLAQAFTENIAWDGTEIQSYGGYDIALIGLVSGEDISEYLTTSNGRVIKDNTYAVVAISNSDGTPMPDTSDDEYGKHDFLVSPYIEGYNPIFYNIFHFHGGYYAIVENGIQYRIVSFENIEVFADHTIYLGVTDGTFQNQDAFIFDETTGSISRNEEYDGVNALFTLSIDPSKADKEKASEIISAADAPVM